MPSPPATKTASVSSISSIISLAWPLQIVQFFQPFISKIDILKRIHLVRPSYSLRKVNIRCFRPRGLMPLLSWANKFLSGVEVGCQCDQIWIWSHWQPTGQLQSDHTGNQLPPNMRILFGPEEGLELELLPNCFFKLDKSVSIIWLDCNTLSP